MIEVTPGPNMGYLAVLSAQRGRLAGLAAVAGVALGLAGLGIAAGLGLGTLVATTPWLYETLRWAGVGYLLWLAWESWRDSRRPDSGEAGRPGDGFRRGLISNLLNPKAALFYVTVVPNFVDVGGGAGQLALLTAVYVAVATAVHATIALGAGSLRPWLSAGPARGWVGAVAAALLVGIAVWLAFSTQRG